MKSEERHKLQQNELADYLAKVVERVKPYQNAILGGILLVLVIILLVHWWNGKSASELEVANTQFYNALGNALNSGEPSELIEMAEKYPDSPAAADAALTAADIYLNNGCNQLFQNKAKANSDLGNAVDLYEKILPRLKDPFLKAQANFGLARAEECQNQLSKAIEYYKEIVKNWPDGPYGVLAASRLQDLERPSTKEIYDKIANFDPKPFKDDSILSDKMPLFDPTNLPKEPLFKTDTLGEKLNPGSEKKDDLKSNNALKDMFPPVGDLPATDEKKTEDTKPADANQLPPESTKPAEGEKPSDSGKPVADEKPAATPPANPPTPETPAPAQSPPPEKTPVPTENGK